VTKRNLGILLAVVGSAMGAWWMASRQRPRPAVAAGDRGIVIFDNTPTASEVDSII
jgi:hypothetical protein